jgi:hypothetical protein
MSGWQLTTLRATKLAGFLHCACGLIGVGATYVLPIARRG